MGRFARGGEAGDDHAGAKMGVDGVYPYPVLGAPGRDSMVRWMVLSMTPAARA